VSYIPQVTSDPKTLRSGALTSAFDSSPSTIRTQNCNQIIFFFDVTLSTATDVRVRLDAASPAVANGTVLDAEPASGSTEWAQVTGAESGSASGGVVSVPIDALELVFTATGKYAYPLPACYKWMRARAKGTGTLGSAALTITATTGMA
jgi:hypothetical protein